MEMKEYVDIERKTCNWMSEDENCDKWHEDNYGHFLLDVDENSVPEFVVKYFNIRNRSTDVLDEVDRKNGHYPVHIIK